MLHLPARVDHLHGTACIPAASTRPGSGGSVDSSSMSDHSKHTAHKVGGVTVLQGILMAWQGSKAPFKGIRYAV
jgi:hypothetical protein